MPRIKLLATSATLTGQSDNTLDLARYKKVYSGLPSLTPAELIDRLPELSRFATIEPDRDWENTDPDLDPIKLWLELAQRLQNLFDADDRLDGAVVVHGTNMMEETAYFLHLVLKTHRPVVLVGAQRPFTALSSDGPINLINAVRTAICPASSGRGVLVAINDEIFSARDVTKTITFRLDTFKAPELGPVGFVHPDRIDYYHDTRRLHTIQTAFSSLELTDLPRVDILYDYHGVDGGLVDAAVTLGARGLVIAASGAGAVSKTMHGSLKKAMNRGVIVVRSSRVGSGRVISADNFSDTMQGTVAADNLNAQKARILLQLALTQTSDTGSIQQIFDNH